MIPDTQYCPICSKPVVPYSRYPRYVCRECAAKPVSEDGRVLEFYNQSLAGGFKAEYADTGEQYFSHDCYINGIKCFADEARFGGIVIQVVMDQKFMKNQLNDDLIKSYIKSFYGFGNYKGRYWFIGMEPGGGNSIEEITRRISIWEDTGRRELDDVIEFHRKLGMPGFFQEPVKLQPTWNRLIRILLSAKGYEVTTEMVRRYQKEKLGRMDGENCIIELLPLSSPSTSRWIFAELSEIDFLKDRETYRQSCIPWRKQHIQERINEYFPQAVIFYGMAYKEHWIDISQVQFKTISDGFLVGQNDKTIFIIAKHPVSKGTKNEYFHRIGKVIAVRSSRG